MSRVITFSRTFPSYHPRKGEPTLFIEKIYASLADTLKGFTIPNDANDFWDFHQYYNAKPKPHTIRAGHRFKVGDWFSPRVWSGKPYNSKQIIIAPDIQIKKVWDFQLKIFDRESCEIFINDRLCPANLLGIIANNDGLSFVDFMHWFQYTKPFDGQIICWNEEIEYL